MGLMVYGTGRKHAGVHHDRDCYQLVTMSMYPIKEMDLETIQAPRLCKSCWPDLPRVQSWHAMCYLCGYPYPYPCEHNGGMQVVVPQRDGVSHRAPGDDQGRLLQTRWVWPENAHHYLMVGRHAQGADTLANPRHGK